MPEKVKPPAMRVDIYLYKKLKKFSAVILIMVLKSGIIDVINYFTWGYLNENKNYVRFYLRSGQAEH